MIPRVFGEYSNVEVQTDTTAFGEYSPFNFTNDENILFNVEKPKLSFEPEMVEGVIRPLGVAEDGTVINHHIPRLFKRKNAPMIRNLIEQIEANPSERDNFVRQMAAALIPGLSDESYHSVFTNSLKLPFRSVPAYLTYVGTTEAIPCTAIFAMDGTVTVETQKEMISCKVDIWEELPAGRELRIIQDEEYYGKIQVMEQVDPISFLGDEIPQALLDSLGIKNQEDICQLITPNDTSFVDVILSLPTLSQKDASDLLAILYMKKLLAPYIRSKVCKLQMFDPKNPEPWPELLGRFIFLLDPNWVYQNIPLLRNNDVMAIFRHVRDMKHSALFVLQTALNALDELRESNDILFFWTLIFMSLLKNATIANAAHAARLENRMFSIWKELQKKSIESNTRKLTVEIIDFIKSIRQFKLDPLMNEEQDFLTKIIMEHHDSIFTILLAIPYKKEESHPLFYPVVYQLESALLKAHNNEEFITSESESLASGDWQSSSSGSGSSRHSSQLESDASGSSRSSRKRRTNTVPELNGALDSAASRSSRSSRHSRQSGRESDNMLSSGSYSQNGLVHSQRSSSRVPHNSAVESGNGGVLSRNIGDQSSSGAGSRRSQRSSRSQSRSNSGVESESPRSNASGRSGSRHSSAALREESLHSSASRSSRSSQKRTASKPASQQLDEYSYSEDDKPSTPKQATNPSNQGKNDSYDYYSDENGSPKSPETPKTGSRTYSRTNESKNTYSSNRQAPPPIQSHESDYSYSESNKSPQSPQSPNKSYSYSNTANEPAPQQRSRSTTGTGIDSGSYSRSTSSRKMAAIRAQQEKQEQQDNDDGYSYSYSD